MEVSMSKVMMTVLGLIGALAPAPAGAEERKVETEIKKTVESFTRGGDRRDVAGLERLLDPSFRVVFALPGKEASVMARADYLALLREGKIGGGERKLSFGAIEVVGPIAHVKVKMEREDARFDAVLTLVRGPSEWRVVQDATLMTPR
jgi:hypothetical protein